MGSEGLSESTKIALLNSNYLKNSLIHDFKIRDTNNYNSVGHEFLIDLSEFKDLNITEIEIDYNFHPGTVSWPYPGVMMLEPNESEYLDELDRFVNSMKSIKIELDK